MKKFIEFTLLSIMFIITGENDCEQYNTSEQTCESDHEDGINCRYASFWEGDGQEGKNVFKCLQIINQDVCQFDKNKGCIVKSGEKEPDKQACQILGGDNQDEEICGLGTASCNHYISSRDKCLLLDNCGYDEKRVEWSRCFMIYPEHHDDGCEFKENKCTSNSNQKFCYLVDEEGDTFCRSKDIQCSDLDQDSSSCPNADLKDSTKKCSYDSSRSSGNKCFEVSIKDECDYDSEDKTCQGKDLSSGKICDMDYSENPVTCQKRNIQCNDLNGDESNCPKVKLPDKSKECSYNTENQKCVEKAKEATCNFNDQEPKSCSSSLPSKIICELNGDKNGCVSKNVECSDFENNQSDCNDAIISDSNKKCEYDSSKAENKCYAVSKECSDFYNEQECNSHKPEDELAKCVWSNECKEKTCETTSTENCGSFTPNDSGKQCSLSGDKTKCEEIPRSEDTKNGAENLKLFLSMLFLLFIF